MLPYILYYLLALFVIGITLWLVNRSIHLKGISKTLLNVLIFLVVIVWLLTMFGLNHVRQLF